MQPNLTKTKPGTDTENPTLSGAKFRMGHKATVVGVLGNRAPEVHSRGVHFFNRDRWTARVFVREMCKWAKENPQCIPTPGVIAAWVRAANNDPLPKREIVIANTPDTLSLRTAMALMGGAYHEAFHTYYSCLRPLKEAEMVSLVIPRWAKVPDWSKVHGMLQEWNNIIEDIRIERRGREDFPGCDVKMPDLQDLILGMEKDPKATGGRAHDNKPRERGALSIIMCVFRDVGLGYNTPTQRDALDAYRAENLPAVEFVIGRGKGNPGPLTALLKEAIALSVKDDLGCIRIAMDVIGILYANSSEQDPANDPNNQQHQPGEAQKPECPACGAPGSKLVIRPKSNGNGGKVQGIGILTCSVCGHQEEVPLTPPQKGAKGQKLAPQDTPKFEGFDKPEKTDNKGGKGDKGDKGDKAEGDTAGKPEKDGGDKAGKPEKGDGSEKDDGDETSGAGAGDENGKPEKDGEGASAGNGGGEGEEEGDGAQVPGQGEGYEEPSEDIRDEGFDPNGTNKSNTDADVADTSAAGGGHSHATGQILGNDWKALTDAALKGKADLLDNNSALEGAVAEDEAKALKQEGGLKLGEALWKPFEPGLDEVVFVEPSKAGKEHDMAQADALYASVRSEASFLRARFRQLIRAMEMTQTVHGCRKGSRLSGRFLVDSKVALVSHQMPKRAYTNTDTQLDTSLAAAIVLDQSGSMSGLLQDATRIMCAITEPLDALGCPVQASGFRNGSRYSGNYEEARNGGYHRLASITHDVFKAFHEPLRAVKWRFANTRAEGGTPMADGVQFGLKSLSSRTEGHRILFVVTDGQPDGGHLPIMQRQIRLAKEAGIHVVGVGIGREARYVKTVFPDAVHTDLVSEMPAALIAKLNEIIDTRLVRGVKFAG